MLSKVLSFVFSPYFFIVSCWNAFVLSSRYNFKAGVILGERKALTGKEFTNVDIQVLAVRLMEEDQVLSEHRRRHGRE